MPGLVGKSLDAYRLVEQIGQGGMSTVYRAVDGRTQQDVAVKVLSPTISSDKQFVRRFRREAGLLFRLRHPNIVPVTDYGEAAGFVYLVMPFVQGDTLHDRMVQQRISVPDLSKWIGQISSALQFAHDQGVIHRDIKPANVMISRTGNALLTDFGLARLVEGSTSLTGSMLMGTPAYVSPEQGKGQKLDARSDQYALGVILYQIAAGRLPFESDTPMGTVLLHIQEPVPAIRGFNKDVSPALERVLVKALAKDAEDRFPSVAALNVAYQAALAGGDDLVRQPTQVITGPRRPAASQVMARRRTGRRTGWVIVGVLTVAVLALAAVVAGPLLLGGTANGGPSAPASQTPIAALPSAAPVASPTPAPTATFAPIESATCPGLRLIGPERSGDVVSWTIDNGTQGVLYLVDSPIAWRDDNPLLEMLLGGVKVLPPPGAVISDMSAFKLPRDERTTIPAGTSKSISLVFTWGDVEPLLSFRLVFTGGCELSFGPPP